jgi:hypothetical protein
MSPSETRSERESRSVLYILLSTIFPWAALVSGSLSAPLGIVRDMVMNYLLHFIFTFYPTIKNIFSLFLNDGICLEMVLQLFTILHII